jgi:hypothetical protein
MSPSERTRARDERGWEYVTIAGERVYTDRLRDRPALGAIIPNGREPAPGLPPSVVGTADDPRGWWSAWDNVNFEAPEERTLPTLGRDGLVAEGGTNLLYSYPKCGKTELLIQMAAEWTDAGLDVRYLTEESRGNWKKRLATHHVTSTKLQFYHAFGCGLSQVLGLLDGERYDVLIVDTLRNTVGFIESEGDKDISRVLHPLFDVAAGRTVVCGYHARKMPGEGGRDISGHHSLYGVFDRALQLTPVEGRESQRRVVVTGRCMYDGDVKLVYEQAEPGMLRALDAAALAPEITRRICAHPDCDTLFALGRKTQKFCSDRCRYSYRYVSREVDAE